MELEITSLRLRQLGLGIGFRLSLSIAGDFDVSKCRSMRDGAGFACGRYQGSQFIPQQITRSNQAETGTGADRYIQLRRAAVRRAEMSLSARIGRDGKLAVCAFATAPFGSHAA